MTNMMRGASVWVRLAYSSACVGACVAWPAIAVAQSTWLGTTDSAWSTSTNWSDGTVPTTATPVVFDGTSAVTPNIAAAASAKSLTVLNPSGTVAVGLASTLTIAGGIDLSAATQDLQLGTSITTGTVNLTQTGTVAVGAGRTLTFGGKIVGFTGGTSVAYTIDGPGAVVASGTVNIAAPTTIRSGSFLTTYTNNVSQPVFVTGGYLSMAGDGNQNFILGSTGTLASLTQTSGTSFFSRLQVRTAAVTISGGTAWLGGLQLGTAASATSTLTVTGSAVVSGTWGSNFGNASNAVARVFLSGGTMTMNSMPSGTNATATKTLTFDGAVLRPSGTGVTLVRNLTSAWVTARGAVIDTNGYTATIAQGLSDATGASGPLTKLGSGTLVLSGSSSYSGLNTISAGVLQAGNASALGTGTITFTGGGLAYTAASAGQDWGGRIRNSTSPVMLDPNGQRVTLTGIDGTNLAGVTVGGTGGTVVLAGASLYAGPTAVNAGTLQVDGILSGTSGVTLAAGATLAGTGTVGGSTTIVTAATLSPGASPGTLAFGSQLTWNPGGNYNWQMLSGTGTPGGLDAWDLVRVGGSLTIAATAADPFRLNLWTLAGVGPDSNGPAFNFDASRGATWTIATAAGGITGFATNKFRIETSATNGTGGFLNALDGGTFSLAVSGNDLNLVFTAAGPTAITINVASGTQTQTDVGYPLLSGSTPVAKTGNGTLVVDHANPLTGSTSIQGGRLQLADAAALASSTIVPVAGGTLTLSRSLQTTVGGLNPNAGGLVDVGSGMVTVASGLSAKDMVTAIVSGMGDGSWNGTTGITSSIAAGSGGERTVGWLDNGDGSLTFAFAAAGDTNLDWQVDILDAANFLSGGKFDSGQPASWIEGDFTYDGLVDILDAASFLSTGLFDAGAYNASSEALSVQAVPEPTVCGWACVGVAALLVRRRLWS